MRLESAVCIPKRETLLAKGLRVQNKGSARYLAHGGLCTEVWVVNFCLLLGLSLEFGLLGGGSQREGSLMSIVGS